MTEAWPVPPLTPWYFLAPLPSYEAGGYLTLTTSWYLGVRWPPVPLTLTPFVGIKRSGLGLRLARGNHFADQSVGHKSFSTWSPYGIYRCCKCKGICLFPLIRFAWQDCSMDRAYRGFSNSIAPFLESVARTLFDPISMARGARKGIVGAGWKFFAIYGDSFPFKEQKSCSRLFEKILDDPLVASVFVVGLNFLKSAWLFPIWYPFHQGVREEKDTL